jgi:hypothetical protein
VCQQLPVHFSVLMAGPTVSPGSPVLPATGSQTQLLLSSSGDQSLKITTLVQLGLICWSNSEPRVSQQCRPCHRCSNPAPQLVPLSTNHWCANNFRSNFCPRLSNSEPRVSQCRLPQVTQPQAPQLVPEQLNHCSANNFRSNFCPTAGPTVFLQGSLQCCPTTGVPTSGPTVGPSGAPRCQQLPIQLSHGWSNSEPRVSQLPPAGPGVSSNQAPQLSSGSTNHWCANNSVQLSHGPTVSLGVS